MINKYIKPGLRSIIRHHSSAVINITGLSLGLTCFAFIALWVYDELSFDKFHEHHDRIFRVTSTLKNASGDSERAVTSAVMASSLATSFLEIGNVVRLKMRGDIVRYKEQQFHQSNILLADPSFFDVFTYELLIGNKATALRDPYSIILTESTVARYFKNENPLGETLTINMYDGSGYGAEYKVTGVMKDPPANSHLNFTMVASFKTIETATPAVLAAESWRDPAFYTYILLNEGADDVVASNKINNYYQNFVSNLLGTNRDAYAFDLQLLTDIHLGSHLQNEIYANGNMSQVILFSSIGVFILFLAGINYVNLSIAHATKRAKEVGVRKIVGAKRSHLFIQYLLESVITAWCALALALILTYFLQSWFTELTGKEVSPLSSPDLLVFLLLASITVGIVAGLYPAVIISGLQPLRILKGSNSSGRSNLSLREGLVIAQFTMTIVLVSCIVVINSQMNYMKHKDLGYDQDALVFLRIHGNTDVIKGYSPFRNDLLSSPLITTMSTSNTVPVGGLATDEYETEDKQGRPVQLTTSKLEVDSNYFHTYGIKLIAGKNFNRNYLADSLQPVLLNEAAVRSIGWSAASDAIGKPFHADGKPGEVIGVVNDFHFSSMHEQIKPLAIFPAKARFSRVTVRTHAGNTGPAIAWLEKVWRKHFPTALLDYDFVDAQIGAQYAAEEKLAQSVIYFSFISLFIACLGLYGLVAHNAQQRVKEIGIRKVLGATVNGITLLLSKHYLKLMLISSVVGLPIAWYAVNRWLQTFAYKISVTWWMFAAAAVLVILVSMGTVVLHAIRAAMMNPTSSLKSE